MKRTLWATTAVMILYNAAPAQPRAEFIDHEAGCRQWQEIAVRIYANYQTKYKPIFGLLSSQARDEEAQARAQGWNEAYIQHLLRIVADAASGRSSTLDQFSDHEFETCMATWRSISTPEERAAETKEIQRRRAAATAANEKQLENVARTAACQNYQSIAIQLIALQGSGATYKYAADWAAAKAYGPGGQVLRYSEENAKHFMALAAAVYFARDKYGKDARAFMTRAYEGCMRGEPLDASPR